MTTFNGLPLYRATLASTGDGVIRVSLVDDPAVCSNFDVFRKEAQDPAKAPALYAVQDEERRLVRGVVLRADFPIFRRDNADDPGYYVTFGAPVIREAAERYLADGHANDVNLQHEDGTDVEGVQMVQLFIKDSAAGIAPEGFDAVADGSLFAEYHVTNDDVWAEIKAGTFRGFSVEIFYTLIPAGDAMSAAAPAGMLDRLFSKIQDTMSFERFKARLAALLAEPETFGSVTTDKGVLHWDGDEDLKAGDRVEVEDADGNRSDAPDGDYTTGDGKVIVVVEGAVSEIKDPAAEVAPAEEGSAEDMKAQAMSRAARFEESYDEKARKILDAIRAARGNREDDYGYLASAGEDFGVYAWYGEETNWEDRYVRYTITWGEDGSATASDPVECRPAFVPMDFDDSAAFAGAPAASEEDEEDAERQMEEALSAAENFKAENATLRARIAELEGKPAGTPAHDAFRGSAPGGKPAGKTGNKGIDRLHALMGE